MFEKTPTRPEAISSLNKDVPVTKDAEHADIYILYEGRVKIGDHTNTHDKIASATGLYYLEARKSKFGWKVDDAGEIFDSGETLVIPASFPNGVMIKSWVEGVVSNQNNLEQINKEVRRKTGQLIANRTNRNVTVQHEDGTPEQFSPIR